MPRLTRYDQFQPTKAQRREFDCGNETLNDWLARFAGQAMDSRDAVTYLIHEQRQILAFFTLSSGSCSKDEAGPALGRRAPDPVPMILLGRMGVDSRHKGRGLGLECLRQAGRMALSAAQTIGARGLLIHAIDENAQRFYQHLGLEPSPINEWTFMISMADLAATYRHADDEGPE